MIILIFVYLFHITGNIWDPFYQYDLTLIPACISNDMSNKVWNEITYPFSNFSGVTVGVWEWIINFIPHFTMDAITYPCWDLS